MNLQSGQWPTRGMVMVPAQERVAHGDRLREAGRMDDARAAYGEAIDAMAPPLGRALAGLAQTFIRQGQIGEARAPLERAVAVEPANPERWEWLGRVCEWAEDYAAAIHCWHRVIALGDGGRALPYIGLGWALQQTGRMDEAEAAFRTAASREPESTEPLVSLGLLEMERARPGPAEAAFRAAVALRADCAMAQYWLANLLGGRLPDADLDALQALADDPGTGEEPRTRLLFAMGHVLDARGRHALAAPRFRAANALQLAALRRSRPFDPAGHERFVGDLARVYDRAFFDRMAGAGG
ncbi:Tetratricopeptide repeat protein [Aquisphaera giovannonii]|uniref:Tetratricopeptide repeat protein n=1 Tax=Aquisphaera giovannonii TaxID=406548 RepID=A0A5B9W852_9BACT|nr:tetratricopeptide repeat protein [Aquisphaera giovannonii]QEH36319.1 Tetratricopeptide repeat protein [Aquisphaera giovannonii]